MADVDSMRLTMVVAARRSPPTPTELSPPKKCRSPANETRKVTMSSSISARHSNLRSSTGTGLTNPPTAPRCSMVAMSITERRCSKYIATACEASWTAVSCCSRAVDATPSAMPCILNVRASRTSGQVT